MPAEAPFSVTAKDGKGNLHTLRGDSVVELEQNADALFGPGGYAHIQAGFREAFGLAPTAYQAPAPVSAPDEAQAIANVRAAFPQATVVPTSTVGAPLPQPTAVAQPATPAAPPVAPPPTLQAPNCAHGVMQYKSSMARGQQWNRWECPIPWQKGDAAHNATRCKAINV